jgi:hypothetical protein
VARREAGDHVGHNSYFIDFPANVPDTMDFWLERITAVLAVPATARRTEAQLARGWVNLLDLPGYGTYQHTWAEMVAAHAEFIPAVPLSSRSLAVGRHPPWVPAQSGSARRGI